MTSTYKRLEDITSGRVDDALNAAAIVAYQLRAVAGATTKIQPGEAIYIALEHLEEALRRLHR